MADEQKTERWLERVGARIGSAARRAWHSVDILDTLLGWWERTPAPIKGFVNSVIRLWFAWVLAAVMGTLQHLQNLPPWQILLGSITVFTLAVWAWAGIRFILRTGKSPPPPEATVGGVPAYSQEDRSRKRELVDSWRTLLAGAVDRSRRGDSVTWVLGRHKDWYTLRARMRPEVMKALDQLAQGQTLAQRQFRALIQSYEQDSTRPPEASLIESEIARIEKEWGLQ